MADRCPIAGHVGTTCAGCCYDRFHPIAKERDAFAAEIAALREEREAIRSAARELAKRTCCQCGTQPDDRDGHSPHCTIGALLAAVAPKEDQSNERDD